MRLDARELEQMAELLRRKRRRALDCAPLALVSGGLAPAAWLLSPRLGVAVAIGAVVQFLLAAGALVGRRLLLESLAIEPEAHSIPEVRRFGLRLATPARRARLAQSIRRMLRDAIRPGGRLHALYLVDRVAVYARELDAIARDLVSPGVRVDPVSVARCNWLLTQSAENPLFDRRLPADDLGCILRRIRAGMHATAG